MVGEKGPVLEANPLTPAAEIVDRRSQPVIYG